MTACTSRPSGGVTLLVSGDPAEIAAYRQVIAAFQETKPGFTGRLIAATDRSDLMTRLSTSIAAWTPPDLFLVNYRFFAQYAAKGALEPIEQRLQESSVLSDDAFFPEASADLRRGGARVLAGDGEIRPID